MKNVLLFALIFCSSWAVGQNGKAETTRKTFSRETSVSIEIDATPEVIWAILTNAEQFPKWNSTVTSLEGKIEVGEKIVIKSILDADRIFKLKVKSMDSPKEMVWADGQGKRVYALSSTSGGKVVFKMTEKIGGLMFPMYAKHIPPFDEVFEKFASDLKEEAEGQL